MKSGDKRADTRRLKDSFGELELPGHALWGAQTQRAVDNFPVSDLLMPRYFLRALALIKWAAAQSNSKLSLLDAPRAEAICDAAMAVASGEYDQQFPIDVFQTGSGTSSNMNANEVIAALANKTEGVDIHPNDHVNMCQSSNDVVPTAIQLSASLAIKDLLIPGLQHLLSVIKKKQVDCQGVVKTGRTHLMDAMPIELSQELSGWAAQIEASINRVESTLPRLYALPLGGTAVGTGINAHVDFAAETVAVLSKHCAIELTVADNRFEKIASQDTAVELSGQLRCLAVSLMKISNDLRWMNSGPLAGLGEISLKALQPGSSIMPGKVNPVICESVGMVAAQVMGNDATIAIAGQSGNFQLNVMLPVIAYNLIQSITVAANACTILADSAIATFTVNDANVKQALSRNPILVTALNPIIGYEKAAAIAKTAYRENAAVLDVAERMTELSREELEALMDPSKLTQGGIAE